MNKREAALILGVRESATANRLSKIFCNDDLMLHPDSFMFMHYRCFEHFTISDVKIHISSELRMHTGEFYC